MRPRGPRTPWLRSWSERRERERTKGAVGAAPCAGPRHGPHRRREVGEGRTARQPGQVRKEAALTRQGGSLSNLPLMRACRPAHARAFARVEFAFARKATFERNLRCSDIDSLPAREAAIERFALPPCRCCGCAGGALSGAGAKIPAVALRGSRRPGAD